MEETHQKILASELDRIIQAAPFDRISPEAVIALLSNAQLVFQRHGAVIAHPEITEPSERLWLLRQGTVHVAGDALAEAAPAEQILDTGALFPLECALAPQRPRAIYTAAEDCFLWTIDGPDLQKLLAEPAVLRWLAEQWQTENAKLMATFSSLNQSRQIADQALALPALSAGKTSLAWIDQTTTLGEAAARMAKESIGSLLIGSPAAPEGIVTQSDLVRRGLAAGLPGGTPVREIMTKSPTSIEDSATVLEAGIEMARHGFRHLLIRGSEGDISGVVSERDLFRLQQQGIVHIFQPINDAASIDELVVVSARVRELITRVFRQGMEVGQFSRLVSSINDQLARRLLSLIIGESSEEQRFCWLAFGSEGREEQGFVTDQDNGLVFVPPSGVATDLERTRYLGLARQVNDALHACGFERCKGNIMAGNPDWCLSLDEWKGKFSKWIAATTPTALLNATIFFDFRAIHGESELADAMRDHLIEAVRGKTIFLHLIAKNALEVAPPVGRLNRFNTAGGEHKGTVDLKTQGSRLFVDIARIYALASGVRTTNTEQRLRIAGQRIRRAPSAIEGDIAAFRFIQRLRLQRQLESLRDGKDANRVDPYLINEVDQRTLREAFRQAQALQNRLRLDYQR